MSSLYAMATSASEHSDVVVQEGHGNAPGNARAAHMLERLCALRLCSKKCAHPECEFFCAEYKNLKSMGGVIHQHLCEKHRPMTGIWRALRRQNPSVAELLQKDSSVAAVGEKQSNF